MPKRTHRSVHRVIAVFAAFLALIVGSLLNAGSAVAQVVLPEAVAPAIGPEPPTLVDPSGTPSWILALVACAVVLIAVALAYGLTRLPKHRIPQQRINAPRVG
jgi:nitrate/nitrite transporter NarK